MNVAVTQLLISDKYGYIKRIDIHYKPPMTIYFYGQNNDNGEFSQFYKSPIVDSVGVHYTCAEQFMMAEKALLMCDYETHEKILQQKYNPSKYKVMGREVGGFDQDLWDERKEAIVREGNMYKFLQNPPLMKVLRDTGTETLAEASMWDCEWGIGLNVYDAERGQSWKGKNLLGNILMSIRREFNRP
jgi:ribA/ribD-fused uncharacterized protein